MRRPGPTSFRSSLTRSVLVLEVRIDCASPADTAGVEPTGASGKTASGHSQMTRESQPVGVMIYRDRLSDLRRFRLHRYPVHDGMPDLGPFTKVTSNSGERFIVEAIRASAQRRPEGRSFVDPSYLCYDALLLPIPHVEMVVVAQEGYLQEIHDGDFGGVSRRDAPIHFAIGGKSADTVAWESETVVRETGGRRDDGGIHGSISFHWPPPSHGVV